MRSTFLVIGFALIGSSAFAQRGASFGSYANPSGISGGVSTGGAGFGRVLFPGTGAPAAIRPGGRGGIPVAPFASHPFHNRGAVVPYPVFYSGGYYPYDAPLAPEASSLPQDYYNPGYQQQSPVVIINQNFRPDVVNPVMRDYSNVPLPEALPQPETYVPAQVQNADDSPTIYLIAMKDKSIFATVAYWVDGETLNYVTREGSLNHASLGLVDRDFSKQLNDERHVEFKLPTAK